MRKFGVIMLLMVMTLTGQAQVQPTSELVGSWSGQLKVGVFALTIVMHIEQADGYVIKAPEVLVPIRNICRTTRWPSKWSLSVPITAQN